MKKLITLTLLSFTISFGSWSLLRSRLYMTYLDYDSALHCQCVKCGALALDYLGGRQFFPVLLPVSKRPRLYGSGVVDPRSRYHETVFETGEGCEHKWQYFERSSGAICSNRFVGLDYPFQYGKDWQLLNLASLVAVSAVPLFVVGVFITRSRKTLSAIITSVSLGLSLSYSGFAACIPLGTPYTTLLGDLRRTRHELISQRTVSADMKKRLLRLLSHLTTMEEGKPSEVSRVGGQNGMPQYDLVGIAQARLATALVSCDPHISARYFYGGDYVPTETNVFEVLIDKLDACGRLRLKNNQSDKLVLFGVSTNRFGMVSVKWSKSWRWEGAETLFFDASRIGLGAKLHYWFPIKNIDGYIGENTW